jgi:hypothetical protein
MSSSDRLNPQQLQMFMPAGELIKMEATSHPTLMPHGLWREGRNRENEWKWKDNQQEDKYLVAVMEGDELVSERIGESIRKRGVIHPVEIGPDRVAEGHHRIAISAGIDPTREIPVLHGPPWSWDTE